MQLLKKKIILEHFYVTFNIILSAMLKINGY